jgi:hypothetical protein
MTDRTYNVTVHKSALPLMKGESLHAFSKGIRAAGKEYIAQKFNLGPEGGAWPVEVFATKAVFNVAPDMKNSDGDYMVAVTYKRTDNGQFVFSDTMKVRPVISFEMAGGVPLTKSIGGNWVPVEDEPVEKRASFWSGVV